MSNIPDRFSGLWPIRRTGSADNERTQINKLFKEILVSYDDATEISWGSITGNIADQKDLSEFWQEIPHSSLIEIQGGTDNEYYHFTEAQHTTLTDLSDNNSWNDYLDFDEIAAPAAPASTAMRLWAQAEQGDFSFFHTQDSSGNDIELGRDSAHVVRNDTGVTLTQGTPVYVSGSTGNVAQVSPARADTKAASQVVGIVINDIVTNDFGLIMSLGDIFGIDLSAYAEGGAIYLGSTGGLTGTAPTRPDYQVTLGTVLKNTPSGALAVDIRLGIAHDHIASEIVAGTFADARIAESNVTQHEAAINHDALLNFDIAEHRIINDAGTSLTELWSANKINSEFSALATVANTGDYNDLINKPDLSALNEISVHADLASFPATGESDTVYIAEDTGYMYRWNGTAYTQLTDQTAIWGQITGTLSNQTDLQTALDGKSDTGHTHTLSDITDSGTAAAADTGTAAGNVPLNSDLGTAAYEDITTSSTDTTSGRVTRVGDFGLGSASLPTAGNLDDIRATGWHQVIGSSSNQPAGASSSVGIVRTEIRLSDPLRAIQTFHPTGGTDTHETWRRTGYGTAGSPLWTSWVENWHTGNLESANLDWTGTHSFDNAISFTGKSGTLDYDEDTVELGNDFGTEQVKCVRIGSQVTITGIGALTHSSSAAPSSTTGVIPSQYRPSSEARNVFDTETTLKMMLVTSGGTVQMAYTDYSGSGVSATSTDFQPAITYNV